MSHTPGPRLVKQFDEVQVCVLGPEQANGRRELVGVFTGDRRMANATFDAAAPDLLEACELTIGYGPGKMPDGRDTYDVMCAAVAKAKGE